MTNKIDCSSNPLQQQRQQVPMIQQQVRAYPQILSNKPIQPLDLINFLKEIQQSPKDSDLISRDTWSPEEDEMLVAAVNQLGPKKWIEIAKFVPTRTAKQCRERWNQKSFPGIRQDPFEPWEDQVIIASQKEIGNRWALISRRLQGRSPTSIKNRWHSLLRNRVNNII